MTGSPETGPSVALVTSALDGIVVGIDALQVLAVEDGAAADPELPVLDLASCWRLPAPAPAAQRMVLRLSGDQRLLVGRRIKVRSVPRSALLAVPGFLEGLSGGPAISGFFALGPDVGCLLDVKRLPRPAAAGEPR